jgi:primase-polymerase (primpol)-like protein
VIPDVPDSLSESPTWVLWDWEFITGKDEAVKIPYSARRRGKASTTDPLTWSSFERCCAVWQRSPWQYTGLGFVFTSEAGLAGIDLDNCLTDAGEVRPWAQGILERFADCYSEISPRGRGVKIFCKAPPLVKGIKFEELPDGGRIEIYTQGRYFCVTGNRWREAPLEVEDHAKDIAALAARLSAARNSSGAWPVNPSREGFLHPDSRHPFMMSLAGTLKNRGILPEIIEALLHMVNERMCRPPKPKPDVYAEIKSIVEYVWR